MDKVRTRRIATLTEVVGFTELIEDLEAAEQRAWQRLLTDWKLGKPVDQREVDEMRGTSKAIALLKRGPHRAAAMIERAEEADKSEE